MRNNQSSDPLSAFEAAEGALLTDPENTSLHKTAVLALARGGALAEARRHFERYNLANLKTDEDALALNARLLKDAALRAPSGKKQKRLKESAKAYEHVWQLTNGHYPGINAATLFLLSGNTKQAQDIARQILTALEDSRPDNTRHTSAETAYYRAATRAEALLILDRPNDANIALTDAISRDPANLEARATTLHQLTKILEHADQGTKWLDPFRPARACHFAGRIRGISSDEFIASDIRSHADRLIADHQYGEAFGALAAGSDIIIAEAFLAAGCQLNVILPCPPEAFAAASVEPFGRNWSHRFAACLDAANTVTSVTQDESLSDRVSIHLAGIVAMGKALGHASHYATQAEQILVSPIANCISAQLGKIWEETDAPIHIISTETLPAVTNLTGKQADNRKLAAMIFADLRRFGTLTDDQVLVAVEGILAPLANSLSEMANTPFHLDTWGDGIFAVFSNCIDAAQAAMNLQLAFTKIDLGKLGLPADLALRIGAHYGPVTLAADPFTNRTTAYGSQVAYAARIEPLAVPGSTWVSEAFSATLALSPSYGYSTAYVGRQDLRGVKNSARLFALIASHEAI